MGSTQHLLLWTRPVADYTNRIEDASRPWWLLLLHSVGGRLFAMKVRASGRNGDHGIESARRSGRLHLRIRRVKRYRRSAIHFPPDRRSEQHETERDRARGPSVQHFVQSRGLRITPPLCPDCGSDCHKICTSATSQWSNIINGGTGRYM